MSSLNKVTLIGNVGKDPEMRSFSGGGQVANFSLATSEGWKDKQSGERKERTQWHNVAVMSENLISVVERFVRKGSKIYIEGQLETRKWQDTEGNDRYQTEVVLRPYKSEIVLLSKGDSEPKSSTQGQSRALDQAAADLDDDIPF